MSVTGWMGFQISQKLKILKKQLNVWKKENFGRVEDQMVTILYDLKHLDLKEENEGLDDEEVQRRGFLKEEFCRKSLQEE